MRVELPDGVLVVFDAAAPPEVDEGCLGYMGYWLSARDKTQYVFGTTLHDEGDLTALLLALERDLGVDLEALADLDDRLDQALNAITEVPNDEIVWEPATVLRAVEIMGFDAKKELIRLDEPGDGGIAYLNPCGPDSCTAGVGPPRNCGSPEGLAREAWAVAVNCCPSQDGGGDPPPTSYPCCPAAAASDAEGAVASPDGTGTVATDCCPCDDCPTTCNDDNSCTTNYCIRGCSGAYCAHEKINCNDDNECTNDSCNSDTGCVFEPKNCDDEEVCTADLCNPSTGVCENPVRCDGGTCCPTDSSFNCCWPSPSDPCPVRCCGNECCYGGSECCNELCCALGATCCQGGCCGGMCQTCEERCLDPPTCLLMECVVEDACDDGNPCTQDICDQGDCGDWDCEHNPLPDGTGCPVGGTCCNGQCCPDDGNPCTIDSCVGGLCSHEPKCQSDQACCLPDGHCCDGSCCGDGCCSSTQYCCNESLVVCCELDPPLGTGLETCCVDQCCATGLVCCGETTCCDPQFCCDGECCGAEEVCCPGVVAGGGPMCVLAGCSFSIGPLSACAGTSVTMELTGSCGPECESITFETIKSHQYLTVNPPGGSSCADSPFTRNFTVDISADAPGGAHFFELVGTLGTGATCSGAGQVTVFAIPTGEISTCLGWESNPAMDVATFSGTLTPPTADFSGRTVTEDPVGSGTGTTDSCWFQGSAFVQYTDANSIAGGTWTVGANNTWQTDHIGINGNIDAYYSAQGRTPCAWHTVQHMKIVCPSGNQEYTTNSFDWSITANGTTISRGGVPCTPPH